MIFGGYLKEIPKPHKRKFEDKRRKREVTVTITMFFGVGKHYYVGIREEDNPIWDSTVEEHGPIGWHHAWDDDGKNGERFSERFTIKEDAERYIKKKFKKHFPKKTHKLVLDLIGETTQWFYKEGD